MLLKNHIASRLLTNDGLAYEMLMETFPEETHGKVDNITEPKRSEMISFYKLIGGEDQGRLYYVTRTVIDKLDMLKVSKHSDTNLYDWTIFKKVPPGKRTFIFDENKLLRISMDAHGMFMLCMIHVEKVPKGGIEGRLGWDLFWVDTKTNRHSPNYQEEGIQEFDTFVYKLMCFIFLTENDEVIVDPGRKHGTKKSGKLINTLKLPITIINSRWNTTVIRTEGFEVSGHVRLQRCGKGFQDTELIFIDPFQKKGYVRRAKTEVA